MEELYTEGLATHGDPESCRGLRKGVAEALILIRKDEHETILEAATRIFPRRRRRSWGRAGGFHRKRRPKKRRSGREVYLIGVIDDHSRYGFAAELTHRNDARAAARALIEAVRRAGCAPLYLKLDNAKIYKSRLFRSVCQALGIELLFGWPYHPNCQGKVERWWKTWADLLDEVGPRSSTGCRSRRRSSSLTSVSATTISTGLTSRSPRTRAVRSRPRP